MLKSCNSIHIFFITRFLNESHCLYAATVCIQSCSLPGTCCNDDAADDDEIIDDDDDVSLMSAGMCSLVSVVMVSLYFHTHCNTLN